MFNHKSSKHTILQTIIVSHSVRTTSLCHELVGEYLIVEGGSLVSLSVVSVACSLGESLGGSVVSRIDS